MAKPNKKINSILDQLESIGIEAAPPYLDNEMREAGWFSIQDAADASGISYPVMRNKLRHKFDAGELEGQVMSIVAGNGRSKSQCYRVKK